MSFTPWNSAALAAIRTNSTPPPVASRALAILHISIYDAVNGISRRHEPYLVESAVQASASDVAAASAAALRVLTKLFPAQTPQFTALHQAIVQAIKDGPQKQAGLTWGGLVADQVLASRANDGSNAAVPPPVGTGPGVWEPTPPAGAPYLLPQWGFVAPFVMETSDALRPNGPPPLDSARWAADYNEVKALGGAIGSIRTADQSQTARFWADGAGTETPPGHWNHIAQDVAAAQGNTLEQNARMFALLNLALADAAICAWDAKYAFNFWRPVTAIRFGDTDGNDATAGDPTWSSLLLRHHFPTTPPATARSAAPQPGSSRASMAATTSRSSPVRMRCQGSPAASPDSLRLQLKPAPAGSTAAFITRQRIRMDWPRAQPSAT